MPEIQKILLAAGLAGMLITSPAAGQEERADAEESWFGAALRMLFGDDEPTMEATPQPPPPSFELARPLPLVEFSDTPREIEEGAGRLLVTLVRTGDLGVESQIRWAVTGTGPSPAADGTDFLASPGIVVFGPGEREKTIEVRLINDQAWRQPERRRLRISIADRIGARLGSRDEVLVDIVEDDPEQRPPPPGRLEVAQTPVFGEVTTGGEAARELLLRNRGGAPLEVSRVIAEGKAFDVRTENCAGSILAAQAACSITVGFRPEAAGAAGGTVTVLWLQTEGDGTGSLQELSVPLSGSGAFAARPDPRAAEVARARRERWSETGAVTSLVSLPRASPRNPELRMESEDYAEIGLGWDRWSYPVPLERVLPSIKLIPCILQVTINSQLDGPVTCVVENPVYGHHGDLGRYILIPAGTVFEGEYKSLEQAGDTRLPIRWDRGFRQDGSSFLIANGLAALDAMGRAGAIGDVDDRFWEKYGSVGLLTLLNVATAVAMPRDEENSLGDAQAELAAQLGEVTAQMMERNLDLRPISTIPKGTRLMIKPAHDMWFPHPQVLKSVASSADGSR